MKIARKEGTNQLVTPQSKIVSESGVDTKSSVGELEKLNTSESGKSASNSGTSGTSGKNSGTSGKNSGTSGAIEYRKPTSNFEDALSLAVEAIYYMYVAGIRNDTSIVQYRRPLFLGLNALAYYLTYRYFKTKKWGWLAVDFAAMYALSLASHIPGGSPKHLDETINFLLKGKN